jgi:hypothetical protein
MNPYLLLCFLLLSALVSSATQQPLEEPVGIPYLDGTEMIALAKNEKFTLPITTRTITHKLEMYPENTNECQFKSGSMLYKPLTSVSFLID